MWLREINRKKGGIKKLEQAQKEENKSNIKIDTW
jgi:hypothetical protein